MGTKRTLILSLLAAATFVGCGLLAHAQEDTQVDYDGFLLMSQEVAAYRADRLVPLTTFNEMKADPDTIILDARSPGAFFTGHIDGAINVNFSDFTVDKLAALIPSTDTRILIYCNNNFSDNIEPVMLKRAPLALNVPTFINLYGYGYQNIYELEGAYSIDDPDIHWVAATLPN